MTLTGLSLATIAALAALAAAPLLRAQTQTQTQTQTRCPPAVKTIWVDAQRDATSGVQTLRDVRLCVDGVLVTADAAEIVGDEMVIRSGTVRIPQDALATFGRGRRTVFRGDQLQDPPQR